jgi:hypothetical protein
VVVPHEVRVNIFKEFPKLVIVGVCPHCTLRGETLCSAQTMGIPFW